MPPSDSLSSPLASRHCALAPSSPPSPHPRLPAPRCRPTLSRMPTSQSGSASRFPLHARMHPRPPPSNRLRADPGPASPAPPRPAWLAQQDEEARSVSRHLFHRVYPPRVSCDGQLTPPLPRLISLSSSTVQSLQAARGAGARSSNSHLTYRTVHSPSPPVQERA